MFAGRLHDKRALAGAIALLLVGLQLTGLLALYFVADGRVRAMAQARWFWEIALNFQIFQIFLMWVCHTDRIGAASGWRKLRAISRLVAGLAGVAPPFLTLVIAAKNNWFYDKPPFAILENYILSVFIGWLSIGYALPVLLGLLVRRRGFIYLSLGDGSLRLQLVNLSPLILFASISLGQALMGGSPVHWILFPFVVYLHGAMPYLYRAFASRRTGEAEPAPIDLF